MQLPGKPEACWLATASPPRYPRYTRSDRTDVAVVGGGIVGVTTAHLLARAGYAVTLLEARRIGQQVTGRSTAKVTCQHGLIYAHLTATLGIDRARSYAEANHCGVELIAALVRDLAIDCAFERKSAYAYTRRAGRRSALEREAEAAQLLGFDAEVVRSAPLPFATAGALRFPNQAQFNPVQYLDGLARAFVRDGGRIFEESRVTAIKARRRPARWRIETGRHQLAADSVVIATALPIAGPIEFDRRTRTRCHVAMAFRAAPGGIIDGVFIDVDSPTHSLRLGRDRDGPLMIVLGPHFATGHDGNVAGRFQDLEHWVRSNVPVGDVAWRWVNEDYDSPDRVPFAGELSTRAPGMYVATGFNGWGISNGTAAAMLITDQIQRLPNPWQALYAPARRVPGHFNRGGDSQSVVDGVEAIHPGEGGVIRHGKANIAVWKAADGTPHAFSAACTHMGCTVTWNNADRTWDCPCHGSMFAHDGAVIHGPATEPLKPARLPR